MAKLFSKINFNFLLLFLVFFVIGFGVYLQFKSVSLPTDENFFSDPPSKIINIEKIVGFQRAEEGTLQDFIPEGSLIVSINGINVSDTFSLSKILSILKNEVRVKFYDREKNLIRNIFVEKEDLFLENFRYLPSAVIIFWVKPDGPSAKAGLQPGDLILSINNKKFSNSREADLILINSDPSKPLLYEILRGNNKIYKEVKLSTFNISFDAIFRYFVATIFLFFCLFLGFKHNEYFPIRLLSLSFLFISAILLSIYSRSGESFLLGKLWLIIVAFSLSFSFAFLAHFLLYFPTEQKRLLQRKSIVRNIYLIATLMFFLIIISYVSQLNLWTNIISNFSFLPIVGYRIYLNFRYKKEILPDKRKIGKKLVFYLVFPLLTILLFLMSFRYFPEFTNHIAIIFYALLALLPIFIFYLFNKYNFYGISYRIRRHFLYNTLKFAINTLFLLIIIITIYFLSITTIKFPNLHRAGTRIEVLNKPLPPDKNIQYEKVAIILTSLAFIFLILFARKKINYFLLKKFHYAKFDYKKTANELSELIIHNLSLENIAKNVVKELENTLLLKKGCLLIYKDNNLCCTEFFNELDYHFKDKIRDNFNIIYNYSKEINDFNSIEIIAEPFGKELLAAKYFYFLPIKHTKALVGTLLLGEKLSETKYTYDDIEFLEIISKNIAIAIENSFLAEELAKQERYKNELEIAQKIQLASLPKKMPEIPGLSISALTLPAFEVGGDFFDFLQNGEKLTIAVGDVSGKGTSAALYMSKVQGIFRTLNEFNLSLLDMLVKANDLLRNNIEKNYFISALLCQFDTKKASASLVRAGHLGLFYFDSINQTVNKLLPKGVALGVFPSNKFARELETFTFSYNKDDLFVFVTDGVLERMENGMVVSNENLLIETIKKYQKLEANSLTEKILTEVCFVGSNSTLFDDLTILVVKPN
ncbi:MAG: SpoIIE family protein phosphatase [Ignavibacteria bacterium]|nr:SpoIIE family protein phosphatase [Ignavibacteria bacterium]